MLPRIPSIKVSTVTTPHPPGPIGGPMAMLAALEGLFISRLDVDIEWLVVGGVTLASGLAALGAEAAQRRRIARGDYIAGIAPHYLYVYLQQLVAIIALFAVALVQTYEPGEHFVSDARDILRIFAVVLFAPFGLIGVWLFALAPPLGASARAGQVATADAARAGAERDSWRSAATVVALGSLVALPEPKTDLVHAVMHPAQLLAAIATATTAIVLLADAAELREARLRASDLPASSLEALRTETKTVAWSFGLTLLVALTHAYFALR